MTIHPGRKDALPMTQPANTARRYEIVVRGRLSARAGAAFEDLTFRTRPGETVLTGTIADQAALYGLLNRLRDVGIELISVNVR
jgi:hypothetical protein